MSQHKQFITFGFGQTVNGFKLDNMYMVDVTEDYISNTVQKTKDNLAEFAFRYPMTELKPMLDRFPHMREITQETYNQLLSVGVEDE
jgi:hypothetical protein